MSDKLLRLKWSDKRLSDIITRIKFYTREEHKNLFDGLTPEGLLQSIKDLDPSKNLRFTNTILNAVEGAPQSYRLTIRNKDEIREGLALYSKMEERAKTKGDIRVEPISRFKWTHFHVVDDIIYEAKKAETKAFFLDISDDHLRSILEPFSTRYDMAQAILAHSGPVEELLDPHFIDYENIFMHQKLYDVVKESLPTPKLPPYDVFIGTDRNSFFRLNEVKVLSQKESNEIERSRDRENILHEIFEERNELGVKLNYPQNKDINVYIVAYPGYDPDLLITIEEDGLEIPVANTSGVERYVSPGYRGRNLATELVLIPNRIPGLPQYISPNGTGLYSPGGFKSREKAYKILNCEKDLEISPTHDKKQSITHGIDYNT